MKESIWGYWIIVLGISVISIMTVLQNYTTTGEQDYVLIKNVMEASMSESVDYGFYRDTGQLKMNAEKFKENFIRRFAQNVNITKTYDIKFYDVYELPPAASVEILTKTNKTSWGTNAGAAEEADVPTRLTGILYTDTNFDPTSYATVGTYE